MSTIKVTANALVSLAQEKGCEVLEQKSFFKITSPEANRKAIYVAKSKRAMTRVDFAGFELDESDILSVLSKEEAKELKLGAVRGQIVAKNLPVETTDEEILAVMEYGIHMLLSGPEGFKLGPKKEESEEEVEEAEVQEAIEEDQAEEEFLAADEE